MTAEVLTCSPAVVRAPKLPAETTTTTPVATSWFTAWHSGDWPAAYWSGSHSQPRLMLTPCTRRTAGSDVDLGAQVGQGADDGAARRDPGALAGASHHLEAHQLARRRHPGHRADPGSQDKPAVLRILGQRDPWVALRRAAARDDAGDVGAVTALVDQGRLRRAGPPDPARSSEATACGAGSSGLTRKLKSRCRLLVSPYGSSSPRASL